MKQKTWFANKQTANTHKIRTLHTHTPTPTHPNTRTFTNMIHSFEKAIYLITTNGRVADQHLSAQIVE